MRARLDEQSVIKANAQFWEQMLAVQLEAVPCSEQICIGAGHMLGSVALTGAWKGRIEVRLGGGLTYYSETRIGLPRNHSAQVDATNRRGPRRQVFVAGVETGAPGDRSWSLGWRPGPPATGLRRWGGGSGDLAHTSTGHSNSGSALDARQRNLRG